MEGKRSSAFPLADGRQVQGQNLSEEETWSWRDHPWEPRVRDARLRATSPTDGVVTVGIVDEPGQDRFSLLCVATTLRAPQRIRRWRRRTRIAGVLQPLKHWLATEACQGHSEDAYYGHLVWRLIGRFVLFDTSRVMCKGRLTMEAILFRLKHSWRFVDLEALELQALS